ncbi:MAG: cytochrome-c peroxidase [Planctomycetota bacterium]
MHTKIIYSNRWSFIVSISSLFGVVSLALLNTQAVVWAEVPKGDHGAAEMKFQIKELDRLLPSVDVRKTPPGFDSVIWQAFIPQDNALTPERVSLGHKLYFEKRLSADGTVSCATCHDVTRGFTDQLAVSEGIKEQFGKRNAPTTLNVALLQTVFLDGRSPTLEHQAKLPIINPIEMGMPDGQAAVNAIKDDAEYIAAFQKAYGRQVNYDDIGRAIASFERTLIFMDSPFRRFLNGDENAISSGAKQGWELFNEKGRCVTCHPMNPSNPLGTDNRFHNVGVSARHQDFNTLAKQALKALEEDPSEEKLEELALATDMGELGRFLVTKNRSDIGAFRTSLLLNIGITPPYMHDGTVETLWDVMDHYNKGGEANLFLDGGMEPLALTEDEINNIVAFLFSLTDDRFAQENQRQIERQKAQAKKKRPLKDDDMAFRIKIAFEK